MNDLQLLDGAEPLYYPGNETGCLVIHGHTGAPHSVKWLAQYLNEQGYTVYAPLLAGHGTTPRDLARVSRRDWAADALAGEAMLRGRCKKVFGLGISLGGALCLWLAGRGKVDGVVALAAPHRHKVGLGRWLGLHALGLTGGVVGRVEVPPEQDKFLQIILAEQRRRGEKEIGRVTYGVDPAHSVLEIFKLLDEMRAGLASIRTPLLFIHSRGDHVVPFEHAQQNLDAAGSINKRLLVLESDRHGIAEHPDLMPEVFRAAGEFIRER